MQSKKYKFQHSTPIQIRFNDIDIMAHVNNSIYQNYFDLARTQYFEQVFQSTIDWKKEALVLAKITIEYFNPTFLDERIEVLSTIYKLGTKSLRMFQQVINSETKEVKAENKAILVSFGVEENSAIPIPNKWKNKIITFEKEIEY
ncbi:MAG: acyl-CoA thioesterase [Bacteroidales bacterium]|nr:acyl-CoA thioesterase [Bacteroidales bacterium]